MFQALKTKKMRCHQMHGRQGRAGRAETRGRTRILLIKWPTIPRTPSQRIRSLRIRSTKDLPHHGCAHHGQSTSRSSAKPSEARPPPKAAAAEGGLRRRRLAPKAPPSLARAADESWDAAQLTAIQLVAYKHPVVGGKACSARTGFLL